MLLWCEFRQYAKTEVYPNILLEMLYFHAKMLRWEMLRQILVSFQSFDPFVNIYNV
jgi:hypothetical protein